MALPQILCQICDRIDQINMLFPVLPSVLSGKRGPVQQQSVQDSGGLSQIRIQQEPGIGKKRREPCLFCHISRLDFIRLIHLPVPV